MDSIDHVPLERLFSPVPRSEHDSDQQQILEVLGHQKNKSWRELDKRYRTVILAEAGAGKTHEMAKRAKKIRGKERPAFLIRIEDIVGRFQQAFEVGNVEEFEQWLSSLNEAWIFLDSVDEARLSDPRDFEKAIQQFADTIKPAQIRAHICISSRPYAWRPKSDRELIEGYLPFKKLRVEASDRSSEPNESLEPSKSELEIFQLNPLNENDIRQFAEHWSIPKIDSLIEELERSDVMRLAARPFDLKGILHKWKTDCTLGSRSELFRHNIEFGLKELHPDNETRRSLNVNEALAGAKKLAAAVILCNKPGIQVPDEMHEQIGIKADAVLSDWESRDIQTLLERAIFNDVIYGSVRFRHREIREFLAAEWFAELLQKGTARHRIEGLIFREQYGQTIVSPRLRPILPWLILKDENIRNRTLAIHPEIAVEGGDPARLTLSKRKNILNGIVADIVEMQKSSSAQDNSALAMIAQPDLGDETLSLIKKHSAHDKAIFYLGRLVWQGKLQKCVPPFLTIAIEPKRDIYARMVAVRAVMSCGTDEQRILLWNNLLTRQPEIPRRLLAELLQGASTDQEGVVLLLAAIEKLPPLNRFEVTGLQQALHGYIERLPISSSETPQSLADLIDGLQTILDRPPHIEHLPCRISQEYSWLLNPAIHAVERLVSEHADTVMEDSALEILLNSPAIRGSVDQHFDVYKDNLRNLVPAWPELNDTLFWRTVKVARTRLESSGERLNDYFQVTWPDHYWSFGPNSFPRVLDLLKTCDLEDDQLVALSLAFQIFVQAERPANWLDRIRVAVKDVATLELRLENMLNSTMSEQELEWQQKEMQRKEEFERQRQEKLQNKSDWIKRLKADPNIVRNPPGLNPGVFSEVQYWLMTEIDGDNLQTSRAQGVEWEMLIDEFGVDVAHAYRDAAMSHWRIYDPRLPSEGADTSSIPGSLLFAMSGLAIEAREYSDFPKHLEKSELSHALRYITWEVNGFPRWLEPMYKTKPQAVMKAILTEIYWELDNIKPDQKFYRLLHDTLNYAPWLHQTVVGPLLTWLRKNDPPNADTLRYCLHILRSGDICLDVLANLAKEKVSTPQCDELLSQWYATWVEAQPDTGIPALSTWLSGLDFNRNSYTAQIFITALMGMRFHCATGSNINLFRTPKHLKTLYVLMHEYIRVEDDTDRANKGAYSPNLRDDAQEARSGIFNLLSEISGKETYVALTELTEEHPNPNYHSRMKELAYKRAEEDGDLEPWTTAQVAEFDSRLTRTPTTQKQLFDLAVDRLTDMKNWLEHADTSPYATWQRVPTEPEMRILVAGQLVQDAKNRFTISQEDEVANRQRMDIRMNNQDSGHPIPIELKLLDKGWSGPKLQERLRNQLVGDYLRDGTERHGVMLLIWQGKKTTKKWNIDGKLVDISTLQNTLQKYWDKISNCYPKVSGIQIIVIDLTLRATKSKP